MEASSTLRTGAISIMQGGTAMNSPLSDLFGQGFILPGGRVINARWYSAMRPCLSILGGALLFYLWS